MERIKDERTAYLRKIVTDEVLKEFKPDELLTIRSKQ